MSEQCIYDNSCPVLRALNIIGGKWRIPILWHLADSNLRYNELRRQLKGITNIMLTRSLRDLEECGLIIRTQYSEIPPHVEYSLSEQGRDLVPALLLIRDWGKKINSGSTIT